MKEGWTYKKLGEVCNIDFGTRVVRSRDAGSKYPVYGGGGATFKMDTYNREDCMVISRFGMSEECTRFVKGKFFLNDSGLTLSMKTSCMIQTFLDWQIHSLNNTIYSLGRGAAQKNLDTKALAEIKITYPNNKEEQQRIVSRLDSAFAHIDERKANAEKQLSEARALFQKALTKAMEPKEGWEEKTIGELTDSCLGKMLDKHKNKGELKPYLRNLNVRWDGFDLDDILEMRFEEGEEDRYGIKEGDLIICEGGEPGRCAIWSNQIANMKIQKALHRVRSKGEIENRFLLFSIMLYSKNGFLDNYESGATIKHLTGEALKRIPISFPPLSEQQRIVSRLDSLFAHVRELEEVLQKTIAECDALKQALLRKVFE